MSDRESIWEYALKWREVAAQVNPQLLEK